MNIFMAAALLSLLAVGEAVEKKEQEELLRPLQRVGREGVGNAEAAAALRRLRQQGPEYLLPLLHALDSAGPAAAHWLRAAGDLIVEQALATGQALPIQELEAFVRQRQHAPRSRELAYDWLARVQAATATRLLSELLDDPSLELRRQAVAAVIAQGEQALERRDRPAACALFRKALTAARDVQQVQLLSQRLQQLGIEVDLAAHFGFIRQWYLLGPFDNTNNKGFETIFPPEKQISLQATYPGKGGRLLRWQRYQTRDPYGVVDLNEALGKEQEVVAYALAVVFVEQERPVEVRAGSNNALQIFLNGQRIYARPFGHHGMRLDQHIGRGRLRAGRNEILVKVCQDAQVRVSHLWAFQLRLCDELGGAIPFQQAHLEP